MTYSSSIHRYTVPHAKGNSQKAPRTRDTLRGTGRMISRKLLDNRRSVFRAAAFLAVMLVLTLLPALSQAEPQVDSWIYAPGHGWVLPSMGGPVTKYVVDPDTGKTYLVEADFWGNARISPADLNDVETGSGESE